MQLKRLFLAGVVGALLAAAAIPVAANGGRTIDWQGNGVGWQEEYYEYYDDYYDDYYDEYYDEYYYDYYSYRGFDTEVCGVENGAPVDGPYVHWVLTGNGINTAPTITIWNDYGYGLNSADHEWASDSGTMYKQGRGNGAWHYIQTNFDNDFYYTGVGTAEYWSYAIPTAAEAYVYGGKNTQLVVSSGCSDWYGYE